MALFDISAEDVAAGTLAKPSWYKATVKNITEEPAKKQKDPSQIVMVTHVTFVLEGAKKDDDSDAGPVTVKAYFPSNAPGMAVNFCNAFGENIGKEGKKGVEISNERHRGKSCKVYVERGSFEGRSTNNVKDFMKV